MDLYTIIGTLKNLEEGTMASAEQEKTGPEFTGYWKGTDAGTPGKQMVGASESVEQECCDTMSPLEKKLRARWEATKKGLGEAGANNPTTATGTTGNTPTAADPKQVANVQKNVNTLKSAGVPIANVQQAVTTAMKDPTNPSTPQTSQDKQLDQTLGQTIATTLGKAQPGDINQLAQVLKKVGVQ
jgi:hypothetical protein